MKNLFFACLLAAMVTPAFSTVYTKPQYCECIGIGMPESSSGLNTRKGAEHKTPFKIFVLRMELWAYLYAF